MAALLTQHPAVHLTINLTPVLLWQIEDYLERGATDRAFELTRKPAEQLTAVEREEILSTFFDADWHHRPRPAVSSGRRRRGGQRLLPRYDALRRDRFCRSRLS